jgi:glycosyltransferase involved in cell wall biosynthesis
MKAKLKIAFIVRSTIYKVVGGDNLQAVNTAEELKKLGVEVDIIRASENINYSKYDLLHLFNIIRPADHLIHIEKSKKPIVISTIYLDYSEFDRHGRHGFQKYLFRAIGKNVAEYLKNTLRFIKGQDKLVSSKYIFGHHLAVQKILSKARILLPNSLSEYNRLCKDYRVKAPYHVVPNGINTKIFSQMPSSTREDDKICCVGQIYGLKNQAKLIEATNELGARLTIIGKPPPNHFKYYEYCKKISGNKVRFIDFMPQQELISYYAKSKVHALPSWFETTGLSSLEAGAMGCNLVVGSGGDTSEYFHSKASFCHAHDMEGIKNAVSTELNKPIDFSFREFVLENYNWRRAAEETLKAYQIVLNNE